MCAGLWKEGPLLLCWEFKRDFEDLIITIKEKQNYIAEEKKNNNLPRVILNVKCNFDEFVLNVVKELD